MDPINVVLGSMLLFAVHLLLVGALTRYLSEPIESGGDATGRDGAVDRDGETVVCPDCGAENERGYTYCHGCVGELPGAVSEAAASSVPSRRGIV